MAGVEPELRELMTQTVKLYGYLSTNEYGTDVYQSDPTIADCHINGQTQEVITRTGAKMAANGIIHLADIYPWLDERANLYIPDMTNVTGWSQMNIIGVDLLYDESGPYAQKIYYGDQ